MGVCLHAVWQFHTTLVKLRHPQKLSRGSDLMHNTHLLNVLSCWLHTHMHRLLPLALQRPAACCSSATWSVCLWRHGQQTAPQQSRSGRLPSALRPPLVEGACALVSVFRCAGRHELVSQLRLCWKRQGSQVKRQQLAIVMPDFPPFHL